MLRIVAFLLVALVSTACGKTSDTGDDSGGTALDSAAVSHDGAAAANDAAGGTDAGSGAIQDASDASTSLDARDAESGDGACEALVNTASTNLDSLFVAYQSCTESSDCTTLPSPGPCFDRCSYPINAAGAVAIADAAAQLCAAFTSQGCPAVGKLCGPPPPPLVCDAGACMYGSYP